MKPVKKELLEKKYNTFPIQYASYLEWLEDENAKNEFYVVSTYNYEVYDKKLWNIKGKEVYNVQNLAEHSDKVAVILKAIGAKKFIVQHEYSPSIWLPDSILEETVTSKWVTDKIFKIKQFMKEVNLSNFDGGFAFDEEFSKFILLFIDYPFLFKYKNVDCISLDADLIVKITSHLDIQFISKDSGLIASVETKCHEIGLRFTSHKTP